MEETYLIDASHLFSVTVSNMMSESGISHDTFSNEEIEDMIRLCVRRGFMPCWEEFMAWVVYGNDKRQMTLAAVRAGLGTRNATRTRTC